MKTRSLRRVAGRGLRIEPLESRLLLSVGPVVISEFMAKNESTLQDVDGDYSDWIELHNTTAAPVDLAGWHLTDEASDVNKWTFPAVTLGASQYMVVFASDKDRTDPAAQLHLNFKLSASGEYLGLIQPDGTVASEYSPEFPEQYDDISYGGDPGWYYLDPTPGAANGIGVTDASAIAFSREGGSFYETFQLTLTPLRTGTIHYTINGTIPTVTSPSYTGPLTISHSTVVRAKLFSASMPSGGALAAESYVAMDTALDAWNSNLPVIVIDSCQATPNQNDYVTTTAMFFEPGATGRTWVTDSPEIYSFAGLKIRGATSANFPKKGYSLELRDGEGEDADASVFGLPTEADWVLYGPYSDKALMRNFLAYSLFEEMGHYSTRTVYCEVFLNQEDGLVESSDYVGVYMLVEKIKIDENRVDIEEISGGTSANPTVTGGAILKVDWPDANEFEFTAASGTNFNVHKPDLDELNTAQKNYIIDYIDDFESMLYGPNFADPETGYAAYIDVDSFIDVHILVEMMKNIDGYRASSFYYFDENTKLTSGPVWDYNLSLGNADVSYLPICFPTGWYYPNIADRTQYPYYTRLFEDPNFAQRYVDRWAELRATILDTDVLVNKINVTAAYLTEAEARDQAKWQTLGVLIWPNGFIGETYAEEVDYMTQFLVDRLAWIDTQFPAVPIFDREPGQVEPGENVTLSSTGAGSIYYTTDGTDPRLPDGGISPSAQFIAGFETTFIAMDSVWRYNDTGTNLYTAWRQPSYNTSSWATGPAELGYGDGDEETVVSYGGNSSSKYPTTYFVKRFDVENAALYDSLTIDLIRDDGAVVYLNGHEVVRSNMPTGTITYSTLASLASDDGNTVFSYDIDPTWLVEGNNCLAVEVHQTQLNSSDLSFNLAFRGTANSSTPIVIDQSMQLTARSYSGGLWSAPAVAVYVTAPELTPVVSEIMYHPANPTPAEVAEGYSDEEDFEFLELYNPHDENVALVGLQFAGGIDFDFSTESDVLILEPGEYLLLARNRGAIEARYGSTVAGLVAGEYSGKLNNAGEQIFVVDANDTVLADITYDDDPPWPEAADGDGPSLEARLAFRAESDPVHWFASPATGGTPGWISTPPVLLPGDANLDGTVDAADPIVLANHWLRSGEVFWTDGDFNADGRVDDLDASILAANWGRVVQTEASSEQGGLAESTQQRPAPFVGPRIQSFDTPLPRRTNLPSLVARSSLGLSRLPQMESSGQTLPAQPSLSAMESAHDTAICDVMTPTPTDRIYGPVAMAYEIERLRASKTTDHARDRFFESLVRYKKDANEENQ
ncbi:MAG: CotH kinase family protein [Pirellulales bacterium]|nr:CotH kinase family protein [Pirellulales bacterium]